MSQCLVLAKKGIGNVSPNPLVGSIVVYKDQIIGEGFHEKYGFSHAEVNAINSVKNKNLLPQSTLYVNLEPCSHYGKTPPCCEFILKNKIKKVVVGCVDQSSKVNGKGIAFLKNHDIEVIEGILEKDSIWLNRRFFTSQIKLRPYIILKWAETKDGFIDKIRTSKSNGINWITRPSTKKIVHKWRNEEDAILVGRKTVENDDPKLTVREIKGRNPIRIIIDPELKLNTEKNIFNEEAKTIIVNHKINQLKKNILYLKTNPSTIITELLNYLHANKVSSIIIEGGSKTLSYFIDNNIWDEARVIIGNVEFKEGLKAPILNKENKTKKNLKEDTLITYYND